MDVNTIKKLAIRFHRGIEVAKDKGLLTNPPFNNFPNACCGDATELVAQYLIEHDKYNEITCRYVSGTYRYDDFDNKYSHAWLEVNGKIVVDVTSDQGHFKNPRIFPVEEVCPCYVGEKTKFHSLFEEDRLGCYVFYDLRCLGPETFNRMKELYDIITECIDE